MKNLFIYVWNLFVAVALIAMAVVFLATPGEAAERGNTKVKETKFGAVDKVKIKSPGSKVKMKEGEDGGEEKVKIKDREAKVKLKKNKDKVKVHRGKAKFKRNGKEKVKGPNGDLAASIALEEREKENARERADRRGGTFRSK